MLASARASYCQMVDWKGASMQIECDNWNVATIQWLIKHKAGYQSLQFDWNETIKSFK